jgi:hypothetical protein
MFTDTPARLTPPDDGSAAIEGEGDKDTLFNDFAKI